MKKSVLSLSVLVGLGTALLMFYPRGLIQSFSPALRSVEFHYTATLNNLSNAATLVRLWLPLPSTDEHQTVSDLKISCPYSYTIEHDPSSDNSMVYVEVKKPQVASFKVDVDFKVARKEYRTQVSGYPSGTAFATTTPMDQNRYLQPNTLIPTTGKIRELALKVTRGENTPLAKARAIYNFVTSTMHYDKVGAGWGRGDALYACDAKHGNCTDFHSLFIAMARSVGIPAKFVIGFPLPENQKAGEIPGYHCWAEFYAPGLGWIPIDSAEAGQNKDRMDYFFGALDANRIQFTLGRDLELTPPQDGKPLNFFIYPYAEVDGKPFADIQRKFTFKDVEWFEARKSIAGK